MGYIGLPRQAGSFLSAWLALVDKNAALTAGDAASELLPVQALASWRLTTLRANC